MKMHHSLLLFLLILGIACTHQTNSCKVSGLISGINTDTIYLTKARDIHETKVEIIPVVDNRLDFSFTFSDIEAYQLSFLEEGQPNYRVILFPINGRVNVEIFKDGDRLTHRLNGGKNNKILSDINQQHELKYESVVRKLSDSITILRNAGLLFTDEYDSIVNALNKKGNNPAKDSLTSRKEALEQSYDCVMPAYKSLLTDRLSYITEGIKWLTNGAMHGYSLPAYYYFLRKLFRVYNTFLTEEDNYGDQYQKFKEKFPGHPYNGIVENIIKGKENIRVGGRFNDFTAKDSTGVPYTLSKIIKGHYAVIDLWYPWCGPCIKFSRELKLVYEEFKDHAFTVVGVAGDENDTEAVKKRMDIENYPWITLIAPGEPNSIWNLYDITNAGGGRVLVDPQGLIVAVHPSADDIRKVLQSAFLNDRL